jgi:hypothetical protein
LVFAAGAIGGAHAQSEPDAAAKIYKALCEEYDKPTNGGKAPRDAPQDDAERLKFIGIGYRQRHEVERKLLEFAKANPNDRNALDALTKALWMVNTTPWPIEMVGEEPARAGALAQIQRDHIKSPKLGPLCQRVSYGLCQEYEPFLRAVLEKNPERSVQGMACLSLAHFLQFRAQRVELCRESEATAKEFADLYGKEYLGDLLARDAAKSMAEVERLLERAARDYADVADAHGTKVGDHAAVGLFNIRNLAIGRQAPDIEGEDQDGRRFKLSDYRGKVVFLDFWSFV